jgi:hypothetical protein
MAKRSLVPETGGLRVVAIRPAGGGLVIEVEPREPAQCPGCGAISTSRHSVYIRNLSKYLDVISYCPQGY